MCHIHWFANVPKLGILNLQYYVIFIYFFQLLKTSFNWEFFSWFTNKKFIFSVISKQKMRYLRFKIQTFDTLANQRMWCIGDQLKNRFRKIWMNHEIDSWLWKSDLGSLGPTDSLYIHKNTIIFSRVGKGKEEIIFFFFSFFLIWKFFFFIRKFFFFRILSKFFFFWLGNSFFY